MDVALAFIAGAKHANIGVCVSLDPIDDMRVPGRDDLARDAELGFKVVHCDELQQHGVEHVVQRIRERVGDNPLYLSIDIDVLDPAHAPGTGTPEVAGISSREMVGILRGLQGLNLVAGDVVEVSPAYDHAEITSLAAATIAFEMINLIACRS